MNNYASLLLRFQETNISLLIPWNRKSEVGERYRISAF